MHTRRFLALTMAACAASLALLAAGCGDDDDDAGAGTTTEAAAPLAIEERVIADGLAGLQPTGDVRTVSSPEDFTEAVDDDEPAEEISALEQAGFQEAAVVQYGDERSGFGISAAIEFADDQGAQSQLQRIFEEDVASDLPPGAEQGELSGVPGSRFVRATGDEGGQSFAFGSVFFTDGPFLYGQLAGGPEGEVDLDALEDQVRDLYERVEGRPAP